MSSPLLKILLIALVCVLGSSQFLNPGCASFDKAGNCLSCLTGNYMYYGICLPVSPLCLTYDSSNGNCLTCYSGFMISGTTCISIPKIANCNTYSSTGACTTCVAGFYLSNNVCIQVNPLCKTYDTINGNCLSCWSGFDLTNITCTPTPIPNCKTQQSIICNACNSGYYLLNNTCHLGDSHCLSYNQYTCLSCSPGFAPAESICVIAIENCITYFTDGSCANCIAGYEYTGLICEKFFIPDPNCHTYDNNTVCLECSKGFYFDANLTCVQVDSLCKTYDIKTGVCTSCFTGYSLNLTTCIFSPQVLDPYCYKFNGTVCIKCAERARFNANKTCILLDTSCLVFNNITYDCLECPTGKKIDVNGTCIDNPDRNCEKWKINEGCVSCYTGFYAENGTCQQIDPFCSNFNLTLKKCYRCYNGYTTSATGTCELNSKINLALNYCSKYDSNYQCISCYDGYYLSSGLCVRLVYPCRTYKMSSGQCTSCYTGYKLVFPTRSCVQIKRP